MESPQKSDSHINEGALHWMRQCLKEAQKKTEALIQGDLAAIDECLEAEANLISRWPEVAGAKRFTAAGPGDSSDARLVCETLTSLALEIKSQNLTNAALTQAGMDFSQALLGVLRPPATYCPIDKGKRPSFAGLVEPTISVKC